MQSTLGGGNDDAFVCKLSASGNVLVYSTYLGGDSDDQGSAIAVDRYGNAYATGVTASHNFPTINPLQPGKTGTYSVFIVRINSLGTALVYSTYLGGSENETGSGIALDSSGSAYVTGETRSTDFPTANAFQPVNHGDSDVFIAKIAPSQWQAVDIGTGNDNHARLLWRSLYSLTALWSIDLNGSFTSSNAYGPYSGWTPTAIGTGGSDTLTRVLWNNTNGAAALWLVGQQEPHNNIYETSFAYGPYPGWRAIHVTVGSDNQARILWTHSDGRIALWSVDNAGTPTYGSIYGPYPGWTARSVAAGADGLTRILWNNTDGRSDIWLVNSDNSYRADWAYGPYPGWSAVDIAVGSDNKARLLWTKSNDAMGLWNVDNNGTPTYGPVYGPYGGWTANRLSAGADGISRVLWNNLDGRADTWFLNANNIYLSDYPYGPY